MADYGKDNFGSREGREGFEPNRADRHYPEHGGDLSSHTSAGPEGQRLGSSDAAVAAGEACRVEATVGTTTGSSSSAYEAQGRSRTGDTEYANAPRRDGFSSGLGGMGGVGRTSSIPGLLRELTTGMGSLVRNEVALAKAEMREKARDFARNAVSVAVGGVIALAGSIILLQAFVGALNAIFDAADVSPRVYAWLSPLIVSLVVLGVAGLLIKKGIDRIKCARLTPERTAQSLRETGEWVKEKVS